jgi:talin
MPLEHVKRWANSDTTFTLDFGGHRSEYYTVLTNEGDAIGKLLAGYIDILMKKRRDAGIVLQDEGEEYAQLEDVAGLEGITGSRFASSSGGGQKRAADDNIDIDKARRNLEKMINEFGQNAMRSNLSPGMQSFREEVLAQAAKMLAALSEMDGAFPPGQAVGRQAMHQAAFNLVQHAEQMLLAAQTAMLSGEDPDGWLGDAARRVADALKDLLAASKDLSLDPNNPEKRERYNAARTGLEAALANLQAISRGVYDGDGGRLISDLTKAVDADVQMHVDGARNKGVGGPQQEALLNAMDRLKDLVKSTANTASDPTVKKFLLDAIDDVRKTNAGLMGVNSDPELQSLGKAVQDTLDMLLASAHLPSTLAERDQAEFNNAAQAIRRDCAQLMGSKGNAGLIDESLNDIKTNLPVFLGKAKEIAVTADKNTKDQMLMAAKRVVETTKLLTGLAAQAINMPDDDDLAARLRAAAEAVAKAVTDLVGDSGKQLAYKELVNQAKKAAANTAGLIASSKNSRRHIGNQKIQGNLLEAAQFTSGALGDLLGALQDPYVVAARASIRFDPNGQVEQTGLRPNPRMMDTVDKFAPKAYKLVASSMAAVPSVSNSNSKEGLKFASDLTSSSIQDLIKASKAMKDSSGQAGIDAALAKLAELEKVVTGFAMAAQNGTIAPHVNPDTAREEAFKNLNGVVRQLAVAAKQLPSVTLEDLGESMSLLGEAGNQVLKVCREIASTTLETSLQAKLANQVQVMLGGIIREAKAAKAASINPSPALNKELGEASKTVIDSLQGIVNSAKDIIAFEMQQRSADLSGGMEEIADSELGGVAKQIEAAMRQLLAVSEANRANASQMSLDEQNLSAAILQACQNIAGTTGRLIACAGICQRERGEAGAGAAGNVYKENAAWKEGLLSAAKAVAGSVTYLVTVANDAAQGNAKDTQLRAAAQSVSVANAQLKSAAQAKGDPTRESYTRMADASGDVTKATNQLTAAAKQAAAWEEEQMTRKQADSAHGNKIQKFQKQAELEELEAQLRAARSDLMAKRKAAYTPAAGGAAPSSPGPTSPPTAKKMPPGAGGKKTMMKKRPPPGAMGGELQDTI